MLKKTLLVASLALLVIGAGRPASADPKFLEEYGDIFGARTLLSSPADSRPKNAVEAQKTKDGTIADLTVSPFYRQSNAHGILARQWGGGLAWTNVGNPQHPWQINANFFDSRVEVDNAHDDVFGWDLNGKYVISTPKKSYLPVVSVVGSYRHINGEGHRIDALVAADEKITNNIYVTANLGWAHNEPKVGGQTNDFVPGFGATWHSARWPRLSLSGDYVVKNDNDGQDFWSVSAAYALGNRAAVRVGGGKDNTFFGNVFWKWGR